MLLLPACSQFFSEADPAADSGLGPAADSSTAPECEGLSLLQENFDADLNANDWYINNQDSGGADATLSMGALELTTSANPGARNVTVGTYDAVPMAGTLAIQFLEMDLASDFDAAFYLGLDSDEGRELGLSITPGAISLFSGPSLDLPSTPFWLVFSVDGSTATVSTSSDGVALSNPTTVSVSNKPVSFLFGLSASSEAKPIEHKVRLGQIGGLPAMPCQ
jgi:hypothetical protein